MCVFAPGLSEEISAPNVTRLHDSHPDDLTLELLMCVALIAKDPTLLNFNLTIADDSTTISTDASLDAPPDGSANSRSVELSQSQD